MEKSNFVEQVVFDLRTENQKNLLHDKSLKDQVHIWLDEQSIIAYEDGSKRQVGFD